MREVAPNRIRRIFFNPRPNVALMTAADLLGTTLRDLKRDIEDGAIVAVSTPLGQRVTREEMIAAAMRVWEQTVIEEALGDDAMAVLPEAIRLVELRARVPRYQREMLCYLARRHWTRGRRGVDVRAGRRCMHALRGAGASGPGFEAAWRGLDARCARRRATRASWFACRQGKHALSAS